MTEMLSLQQIKDKLDAIAVSQGTLLAALDDMRESAMRNHQQIRAELAAVKLCRKRPAKRKRR